MTIKHVPVVHKRSSVAGKVPTAEMLRSGELAINTADGLVYAKKDDDSVIAIGASPDLSGYAETSYVDTEITNAVAEIGGGTESVVGSILKTTLVDETINLIAGNSKTFTHADDTNNDRTLFIEKEVPGGVSGVEVNSAPLPMVKKVVFSNLQKSSSYAALGGVRFIEYGGGMFDPGALSVNDVNTATFDKATVSSVGTWSNGSAYYVGNPFDLLKDATASVTGSYWLTGSASGSLTMTFNTPIALKSIILVTSTVDGMSDRKVTGLDITMHDEADAIISTINVTGAVDNPRTFNTFESLSTQGETVLSNSISLAGTTQLEQTALVANGATTALSTDGGITYSEFSADHGVVPVSSGTDLKVKVNLTVPSYPLNGADNISPAIPVADMPNNFKIGSNSAFTRGWHHGSPSKTETFGGTEASFVFYFDEPTLINKLGIYQVSNGTWGIGFITIYGCVDKVINTDESNAAIWDELSPRNESTYNTAAYSHSHLMSTWETNVKYQSYRVVIEDPNLGNYGDGLQVGGIVIHPDSRAKPDFSSIAFNKTADSTWILADRSKYEIAYPGVGVTSLKNISGADKTIKVKIGLTSTTEAIPVSFSGGLVNAAIKTVLTDQQVSLTSGSSQTLSHVADPNKLRSVFIEKEVPGGVTGIEVNSSPILSTQGETVLADSISLAGTIQLEQTALVANGATTALSTDGGLTYGEFSSDHGVVAVSGGTDLKVKVNNISYTTSSMEDNILDAATVISENAGTGTGYPEGSKFKGINNEGMYSHSSLGPYELIMDAGLNNKFIVGNLVELGDQVDLYPRNVNISVSDDNINWVVIFENGGPGATYEMSGNGRYVKLRNESNRSGWSGMSYISIVTWDLTVETSTDFSSIAFNKTADSTWLLDNDAEWEVGLTSSIYTSLKNISDVTKNARVRVGATSVLEYDYTKTIAAGGTEVLTLPVAHGDKSVAHVKQYVPGDTVSDTKWDFDLIDSNQWDGGSVEGGKIGLFNLSPIKSITEKTPISGMTEGFALSVKGLVLDGTGILRFFMGGYATMGLYIYTDGRLMAGINGLNESSYGFTFAIGTSYDVDIVATAAGAVTVTIDNVLVGTISRSVNFGSATGMFAYDADTPQTFNSFTFDDYSRNYESTSTVTSLSSINTGIATAINGITVAEDKPVGTDAKYALSFDGKATWTALMDSSELTAFDFSSVTLGDSLDVQMVMSTTDSSVTPTVDQITVDMATQGVWAQASVDPDKFMVIESETNKVSVTNNTDSEKTLKINVGI